ncbi:MAG: ACT domain-containing protein [Thiobacillaceae bacterium]|jgi:glycine cleavage system transcriptional repressor
MAPNPAYLVITASGEDKVGLVDRFSSQVTNSGCNIEESRMVVLGGSFALVVLVSGESGNISALEQSLPGLGESLGLTLNARRTQMRHPQTTLPYEVEVVALDHPGIVKNLAGFFAQRGINIEELTTDTYPAPHTGSPMFSVHMTVGIPPQSSIAGLREAFSLLCDSLNLDGTLEPRRS